MENEFYRFEFKYEMTPSCARMIETEIKRHAMKLDKHIPDKKQEYVVTSLYFDSCDLSDYYDKMGGYQERKKLRARIYEPYLDKSNIVWLEVKKKDDMKIHKKRFSLTPAEWKNFLEIGPTALFKVPPKAGQEKIKQEVLWHFLNVPVRPSVLVRYKRKPYVLGSLRVTFDRQIEACKNTDLDYNRAMVSVKNKGVIMEIKFAYLLPFWFRNIIQKYNLKRNAFSKYSNSIDAIERHDPLPR